MSKVQRFCYKCGKCVNAKIGQTRDIHGDRDASCPRCGESLGKYHIIPLGDR